MKFGRCDLCGKTGVVGLVACLRVHFCADCASDKFAAKREEILADFRARLITDYVAKIRERGPTRVIIEENGLSTTPARAFLEYHKRHDVVFVREDGWSLGAPEALELAAHRLWPEDWLGVLTLHYREDGTFSLTTELIEAWRERKAVKT